LVKAVACCGWFLTAARKPSTSGRNGVNRAIVMLSS